MYVSLAEWGGSSAASHLPVAAWPAGAIVGDGLCGGAKQGMGGTAAFKLPVTSRASNKGSRRFHNHGEGPEDPRNMAKMPYELCIVVPITCLLTMG